MIPPLVNLHVARNRSKVVALMGRFVADQTRGVPLGDLAAGMVADALEGATGLDALRASHMTPPRFAALAAKLTKALGTTTDTSFPAEVRPQRDRVLRIVRALCDLGATDSSALDAPAAAVLATVTDGLSSDEAARLEADLVRRLTEAGLVARASVNA